MASVAAAPEPDGYRMDHYRDEVPDTLRGARVMHTAALARFIAAAHPVIIDVLPAPTVPPDARGLPRLPLPQEGLPGTLWLPETGRGALSAATDAWFRARLAQATGGRMGVPVVFYCLSRCWMSWNAARRAVGYGYRDVVWYPDGADGWRAAGLPTVVLSKQSFFEKKDQKTLVGLSPR